MSSCRDRPMASLCVISEIDTDIYGTTRERRQGEFGGDNGVITPRYNTSGHLLDRDNFP